MRKECPSLLFCIVLEVLSCAIKPEREVRDMRFGKEEIEPLSFADNRKHKFIDTLVRILEVFQKSWFVFTIQKPIVCLNISNKHT